MPRDWTRDEIAIRRHCNCEFVELTDGRTAHETDIVIDNRWKLAQVSDNCPLHASDARFDLPDGVL